MTIQPSGRPVQPTIHVIGGVTLDLIMGPVAPWPQPGTETFVAHSELRAGGPAGNTALALRALRVRHRVISNIGNDIFGQWLADAFGETAYGWQRVSSPTSISIGIEHPGGERSFLTAAGNLAEQTAADILGMLPARAAQGDIALLTGSVNQSQRPLGAGAGAESGVTLELRGHLVVQQLDVAEVVDLKPVRCCRVALGMPLARRPVDDDLHWSTPFRIWRGKSYIPWTLPQYDDTSTPSDTA